MDGLDAVTLLELNRRSGSESLRFCNQRFLAGSRCLKSKRANDPQDSNGAGSDRSNTLALAGSVTLAEVVVVAVGDGGDDAL